MADIAGSATSGSADCLGVAEDAAESVSAAVYADHRLSSVSEGLSPDGGDAARIMWRRSVNSDHNDKK